MQYDITTTIKCYVEYWNKEWPKKIQKQKILNFNSNDEYFHVKNKKKFQKALNDKNAQKQVAQTRVYYCSPKD